MAKRAKEEIECIKAFKHISVQSEWSKNQIWSVNPDAKYYVTRRMVRHQFHDAEPWQYPDNGSAPKLFTSSSGSDSYKGLHILLRGLALVKKRYPNVQLHIAGAFTNHHPLLRDGYTRFLMRIIKELKLDDNVVFLGSITADDIVRELQSCNVCVIPTFVESYCAVLAEAMMVGTPCVVSYAGAMPEFAENGKDALFYNTLDYASCAQHIIKLIEDKDIATCMSKSARERKREYCDNNAIVSIQESIYSDIIESENARKLEG
jgi:glycosyltransferase involved in cell wall biosynthesis